MTEPHNVAGVTAALAPDMQDPATLPGAAALRGRTFWSSVWRIFRRSWLNRIATAWIGLIVLLAVIVPFVANNAPYTVVIDGQRYYPLFRNLTRADWIVLCFAAAALIYALVHWFLGRGPRDLASLRTLRLISFLLLAALASSASVGVALLHHDYLDTRDYHALAREGRLQNALFAPLRWGYADAEPLEANRVWGYPGHNHYLGTDGNGRDVLARLLWSARIVLGIGLISEIIALVVGVIYGAIMGYFVGKVDIFGMRFVEIVEAVPTLFLLITFVAIYGRNVFMLMVIIGLTSWTGIARFVRAEFLRIRNLDYVTAAKATGLPLWSILFRHMLPNGLTPVIVTFTFGVATAVISESILSFLGIGVEPPTPSWGSMLNEAGNPAETFRWWLAIAPGLLIFLTVFAYNIIGEGLRDAIDPRMNGVS